MKRSGSFFAIAFVAILFCILPASASAQQSPPAPLPPTQQGTSTVPAAPQPNANAADFKCPRVADPHRRSPDCNDQDFPLDETLAGGWDVVRRAMKPLGIRPTASYIGGLQTNATGGSHQVWSYAGLLTLAVNIDLDESLRIPGLSAYADFSWGTGSYLAGSLDSPIPTSGLYAPSYYLGQMYLQQKLDRGKLTLLAGRLAAGNAFANLPAFSTFVNYGINPNPYSIGANDITFFGPPPGTEWGVQASYAVGAGIQLQAGVFNTNINSAFGVNHGADFALQEGNKGALSIGEIDYQTHRGGSKHKPGQIAVGFLHSNNSFPTLNNGDVLVQSYSGTYVLAQQMIYRPGGPGTTQGATIWGAYSYNNQDLTSPMPQFWAAGASYLGLIPARKNDVVSVGIVGTEASKFGSPLNTERLLELNYQWLHSRYLTITPHGQYLWLNGPPTHKNALVLGIQFGLTL